MKKVYLPALLILFSLLLLSFPAAALEIGAQAPDFELPTLEGKTVRLSDFKGQIILLKLATTWCPTCKQQTEEIQSAGTMLKEKNVAVVEVFLQDSEAMVREYLQGEKYEMPHTALLDDGKVRRAYGVYLIPRVLFIGPDFTIRRDGSLMSARELIRAVEKIGGGS